MDFTHLVHAGSIVGIQRHVVRPVDHEWTGRVADLLNTRQSLLPQGMHKRPLWVEIAISPSGNDRLLIDFVAVGQSASANDN